MLLGIDTGGTFTDFVLLQDARLVVHKVLSTPTAPQDAILQGIAEMGIREAVAAGRVHIIHGTTVATNATLEGKGVRTAYITNRGLGDVLRIGRQTRQSLYSLSPKARSLPIDDDLVFEVDCRLDASGKELQALTEVELQDLRTRVLSAQPKAIAINLLFSFLDPAHELAITALFDDSEDNLFVSRSSEILPEYREYERGMTTWVNAWIGPLIHGYMNRLQAALRPTHIAIMQSNGLTIGAHQAARRAVNLLLSGPAGGLTGAMHIGRTKGRDRLMTFDMGGTSTDVALLDGQIRLTRSGSIADLPIGVPMADIHTIGAGGGSIAFVDAGGLLNVGPASAGADPGPACYGRGGTLPTVTDANLVLGRLQPMAFLGGAMQLDYQAAELALAPLAKTLGLSVQALAEGIIRIANEHMTQALRVISVQRGYDPRDFTLVCFGGAGGLHFCDLAEALAITEAIVPIHSGVLSALGMLAATPGREMVRTYRADITRTSDQALEEIFAQLTADGMRELEDEGVVAVKTERSLDLRYVGQTHTLNLPYTNLAEATADFHAEHRQRYGHDLEQAVELLNLRVHLEADRDPLELPAVFSTSEDAPGFATIAGISVPVSVVQRESLGAGQTLDGPVLITERHSTTLINPGWRGQVDGEGNLLLRRIT
ncbi:MAG: hydantoinase/oxoprolinase family protein [Pseudomonadota bacterium]